MTKKTAVNSFHQEMSAKMVDYAGWEMPIVYTSIVAEHLAVREKCGIFDVSHMGEFFFEGKDAQSFVDYIVTNNVANLGKGQSLYSPLLYDNGTFVDDVIVYIEEVDKIWMVVNAANIQKDFAWIDTIRKKKDFAVEFTNVSEKKALLAIQGKTSFAIIEKIFPSLESSAMFSFSFESFKGSKAMVCRTGYTGEKGVEVMVDNTVAEDLFKKAVELGAVPCGLGARDTLRLEKGYSLYGQEITDETNALEAGLGWTVDFNKKDFIGKDELLKIKAEGVKRKLSGFVVEERGIVRSGATVFNEGLQEIGVVTSGAFSPSLRKSIGLCYLPRDYKSKKIIIEVREKKLTASLCKRVFL